MTAIGGRTCTSSLCDSWVMYLRVVRTGQFTRSSIAPSGSEPCSLLQNLALGCLRVAKVHDFVEKFVAAERGVGSGRTFQ